MLAKTFRVIAGNLGSAVIVLGRGFPDGRDSSSACLGTLDHVSSIGR